MTNVTAPKLPPEFIVNSIYGWTNGVWTPGIVFPGGSLIPPTGLDKQLFIKTPENRFKQYQNGNGWVDVGPINLSSLVPYGTSFPASPAENDLFNRLDEGKVYQRINSAWVSLGPNTNPLPTGTDTLNFYDNNSGRGVGANLFIVITKSGNDPLLATDRGMVIKKDLSVGGFISANQGIVYIGHGCNYETEPPKIILTHSGTHGTDTLYLEQFNGSAAHLNVGTLEAKRVKLTASGNSTTDANGTAQITFASGTFPSGYAPVVVCTAFDPSGRSITAVVTAKTNLGFTVKTFLSNSGVHNHKVGDARASTSNPLAVNSVGTHTHGITNGSPQGATTSTVSGHNHTYTTWVAATVTGSSGSHDHSLTKPSYVRELAMRKQDGSTYPVGVTMTTSNEALTEMWTHDNSSSTTNTPVQASFDWIAM